MKRIILGDTHLGLHKSSNLYLNVTKNLFEEIKATCEEHNIKEIIHLGDFFHERKATNTKAQNIAYQIVRLLEDFSVIILIGNHDTYYKDKLKPTTLETLLKYENITVIDEITEHDDIVLCPWSEIPRGFRGGYCMGHFELIGFKMNNTFVCDKGQNPEDLQLNDFKHIYSGHFHTPSKKGNITYLGSPYQMTMNDIGSPRGYYIWEDGELEFIEFKKAPKFIKLTTDNINTEEIKGNFIKLLFVEDYGTIKNQQIVDELMSFGPQSLQVDFSGIQITDENVGKIEEATLLNHNEIIVKYVNKIELPSHIKRKTLLSMIDKLKEDE